MIANEKSVSLRNTLPIPSGFSPFQLGTGDHVAGGAVAGGAAPHVPVVERVHVDELHREVARLLDLRIAHHERLGPKVHGDERVRRVAVGRDDRRVLRRVHARRVVELVERRLVLRRGLVDEVLVEHGVVHDHREAVDERLLGDLLGFAFAEVLRCQTRRGGEQRDCAECERRQSDRLRAHRVPPHVPCRATLAPGSAQNRDASSFTSARDQARWKPSSAQAAWSDFFCAMSACERPNSDQPFFGHSSRSRR